MIIKEARVIDVRTPMEFAGGHVEGSINIPLDTIPQKINDILKMSEPVVLCCASGSRSFMATQFLKQNGCKDVQNGGAWQQVAMMMNN